MRFKIQLMVQYLNPLETALSESESSGIDDSALMTQPLVSRNGISSSLFRSGNWRSERELVLAVTDE